MRRICFRYRRHELAPAAPNRVLTNAPVLAQGHAAAADAGTKVAERAESHVADAKAGAAQFANETRDKAERAVTESREKAERAMTETKEKAERAMAEAREGAERAMTETKEKAEAMAREAREKAEAFANEAKEKAEAFANEAKEKAEAFANEAKDAMFAVWCAPRRLQLKSLPADSHHLTLQGGGGGERRALREPGAGAD